MPAPFQVMAKPSGARCNLACRYCFFREKEKLYPGSAFRMTDEVLEAYIRQVVGAARASAVSVAWQGGEPTLLGLDFYRRSILLENTYRAAGTAVARTFQTNGLLLDGDWCAFFREHDFLVGLSMDGPRALHDVYRRDQGGNAVFDRTMRAARLLQKHGVAYNILCTVNAVNSRQPLEVYRFFRDELGARCLQFIPVVEQAGDGTVTDRSVRPEAYGRFLIEIFDEWIRRDVGEMFVTLFDGVLASWLWGRSTLCIFQPACGDCLVLEHNGDLYSCDHFVDPEHLLGNILKTPLDALASSERQVAFGRMKSAALPRCCRECDFLFACYGECPKNRVLHTPDGEPGLNWLCAGLKAFFRHADRPMRIMAELLRRGRPAPEIMGLSSQAAVNEE